MTCGNLLLKILLLFPLISSVRGTFEVKATQTSYQAEENKDITMEFMFTTKADSSHGHFEILYELLAEHDHFKVFNLNERGELPKDKQFAGRVQYDKDLLREGRLRLNLSRLTTRDSGEYQCTVHTSYGHGIGRCSLNVTAARHLPEPVTPRTSRPQPESRGLDVLYWVLGLGLAGVALLFFCRLLLRKCPSKEQDSDQQHAGLNSVVADRSVNTTQPEQDPVIYSQLNGQDSHSDKSYSSGYGGEETD